MLATMADAHREWHHNTGIPMGTPGCPQDACHLPDDFDEPYEDFEPTHFVHYTDLDGVARTATCRTYDEARSIAREMAARSGRAVKVVRA